MSLNTNRRYRKPLSFTFIFVVMLLLIFAILQIESRPTADKDRVTNATDIKVMVKTSSRLMNWINLRSYQNQSR